MQSVLRYLRGETEALHHEAERHVRILDDTATEASYARFLARMLGFHGPIEDRFTGDPALAALGFDARARRKQDLLRHDLAALGVTEGERCTNLPDTGDVVLALGTAYVLEGSTLGGPFILNRMRSRLGHLTGTATRFLEGYGAATGPMWRAFGELAERGIATPEARERAAGAACETFRRLIEWLDEPAADPPHPFRRGRRAAASELPS
jgi:heme oxygenase